MRRASRCFAIKVRVDDPLAASFVFTAQKTMYGGKTIDVGDRLFIFASEHEGGCGLIARGRVTACDGIARTAVRETPRVSVELARDGTATRSLGREQLRAFRGGAQEGPEAELDFKLYRQATNKIVGLSEPTGTFLDGFF